MEGRREGELVNLPLGDSGVVQLLGLEAEEGRAGDEATEGGGLGTSEGLRVLLRKLNFTLRPMRSH